MIQTLKNWMLPVAMIIGTVANRYLYHLSFLMPWLIFFMLLFTFSRIPPKEVRFNGLHLWLIVIQLVGSLAVYLGLSGWSTVAAEGVFICVLAPTATAAAVITWLLGVSVGFLTSYILLSNVMVSVAAPVLFSFIGNNRQLPFWTSAGNIALEVMPMLVLPLLIAWAMRWLWPRLNDWFAHRTQVPLYLWAVSLTVVTGRTVHSLLTENTGSRRLEWTIAGLTFLLCGLQFLFGRKLGRRFGDAVSGGQSLGQKNTVLAIWMSNIYLHPVASIGPASYILWQNIVNSWQLWRKQRRNSGNASRK